VNFGHLSYVDSVASPTDLMITGELVFFGRPVGPEVLVKDFLDEDEPDPSIQIIGQTFAVTHLLKGDFEGVPQVTVIRTHLSEATVQPEPPFLHPLYLLALRTTEDSYGLPAWYTVAGPAGRIPFSPGAAGELVAVVESPGARIQRQLAGMTQQQAIGHITTS
jgi:hypothetical protein